MQEGWRAEGDEVWEREKRRKRSRRGCCGGRRKRRKVRMGKERLCWVTEVGGERREA